MSHELISYRIKLEHLTLQAIILVSIEVGPIMTYICMIHV